MKVLVYEDVIGSRGLGNNDPALVGLEREARQLLMTLIAELVLAQEQSPSDEPLTLTTIARAEDLSGLPDTVNLMTCDQGGLDYDNQLRMIAAKQDAIVVIAPEIGGRLRTLIAYLRHNDVNVLAPDDENLAQLCNKRRWSQHLSSLAIPELNPGESAEWILLKPTEGAGGEGNQILPGHLSDVLPRKETWLVQPWRPGASISQTVFVFATGERLLLPAATQRFISIRQQAEHWRYVGGELPVPWDWQERANDLSTQVLDRYPTFIGCLGIDMVLHPSGDSRRDCVVDLNPRVTSSVVGHHQYHPGFIGACWKALAFRTGCPQQPPGRKPIAFRV